jgi:hypothetical protein
MRFKDLPGRPGFTECEIAGSVSGALKSLRAGQPVTAAGDNGSLNCYATKSKSGAWGCLFYRYQVELSRQRFTRLSDVRKWLREWFPQLGDRDREARRAA